MQVSTKPGLKEKKSLPILSTPKYTSGELGFCYHYIGYYKGKGFGNRLMFVFLLLFSPFSSSLTYLNFASERPNQVSHASLLHTDLISWQQLWENAFPTCSAVLKILSRFCSYFRIHHSEGRFRWSLPLVVVQLWLWSQCKVRRQLWLWRVALGKAGGTERNNQLPLESTCRCCLSSKGLRERYRCDSKHHSGFDNDIMHS